MQPLNFPDYEFDIRTDGGREVVFDTLRRKYVRLTPEEWVRQHLLRHLIEDLGFPRGRTAVETGFSYQGLSYRADVIRETTGNIPQDRGRCTCRCRAGPPTGSAG